MNTKKNRIGGIVIAVLAMTSLAVPALHAQFMNQSQLMGNYFVAVMEQVNFSSLNQSHPTSYHNSIFQPITIYRAELNDTTLPGPRYMAFGPSVISVSINPLLLGILILIIALSGAVIYIIRRKKETEEKMLKDDEH